MNGLRCDSGLHMDGSQTGAPVKLLLIGGVVGLVIGVVLTVFYFSLATFFAVQAKALDEQKKAEEERNKNAQDKKPGRAGHCNLAFAERSHLPQKINPGGESAHGQPETNFDRLQQTSMVL